MRKLITPALATGLGIILSSCEMAPTETKAEQRFDELASLTKNRVSNTTCQYSYGNETDGLEKTTVEYNDDFSGVTVTSEHLNFPGEFDRKIIWNDQNGNLIPEYYETFLDDELIWKRPAENLRTGKALSTDLYSMINPYQLKLEIATKECLPLETNEPVMLPPNNYGEILERTNTQVCQTLYYGHEPEIPIIHKNITIREEYKGGTSLVVKYRNEGGDYGYSERNFVWEDKNNNFIPEKLTIVDNHTNKVEAVYPIENLTNQTELKRALAAMWTEEYKEHLIDLNQTCEKPSNLK